MRQISALASIFAVTTVVTVVTAVEKMGGVDVFMFVMEDNWGGSVGADNAKKVAFIDCLRNKVFDFGNDIRHSRLGFGCAGALEKNGAALSKGTWFFSFGKIPDDQKEFCPSGFNEKSMNKIMYGSHDVILNDVRPGYSLVSIVVAGKDVEDTILNNYNRVFDEFGNMVFIVTVVEAMANSPPGRIAPFRIMHFDGTCSDDFVDKFHRGVCKNNLAPNDAFNKTECILKPGATSECHQNVTLRPEVKHADIACQKYPIITEKDCICNETEPDPVTTTAKSIVPETTTHSGVPYALITGLGIGLVVVLVAVGVGAVAVFARRRERQRRILATKMVVGDVAKSQMSRASLYGGKSQISKAQSARTRSVAAKMQSKKMDQSQMSKKTQKSKTQMSKTQQQKSQVSQSQTPKSQVPQKSSRMSKSPSAKVKAGKSQMSRSPSSKVKGGKSQMYNSPSSKAAGGKSQMGKMSKMSRK